MSAPPEAGELIAPPQADEPLALETAPVGTVVRRAGPRFVRDAFGPLAAFYAGWKLIGLTVGIGLAVLLGLSVFVHERRQGRPAMVVRLALVLVGIRALVGLSSGSARVYLGQEIAIDTLLGSVVLATLRGARPFASWFVEEIYEVIRAHGGALVVTDEEKWPRAPLVTVGRFAYFRLRRRYPPKALGEWIETVWSALATHQDVHVYFKHDPQAPRLALRVRAAIAAGTGSGSRSARR